MLPIAGWTDWAEILCGHSGVAGGGGVMDKKLFFSNFFFHGQRRALQLVMLYNNKLALFYIISRYFFNLHRNTIKSNLYFQ